MMKSQDLMVRMVEVAIEDVQITTTTPFGGHVVEVTSEAISEEDEDVAETRETIEDEAGVAEVMVAEAIIIALWTIQCRTMA